MAILLPGGSALKDLPIFSHMGLCCISLNTFFKYQRVGNLHTQNKNTILFKITLNRNFVVISSLEQAISNNSTTLADMPEKDAGQGEKQQRGDFHSRLWLYTMASLKDHWRRGFLSTKGCHDVRS